MTKTVWSLILVAAVLLTVAAIAEAQQPKKVYRIGYLSSSDPAADSTRSEAVRLALHERSYPIGRSAEVNGPLTNG